MNEELTLVGIEKQMEDPAPPLPGGVKRVASPVRGRVTAIFQKPDESTVSITIWYNDMSKLPMDEEIAAYALAQIQEREARPH
jgi:hypothetical protein